MDNKTASLIVASTQYINLIRELTKRFKTEANSDCGLIIINKKDYRILFVNTSTLKFLNKQWVEVMSEPISSVLTREDFEKVMYCENNALKFYNKLLGKSGFNPFTIELINNNDRAVLNVKPTTIIVDGFVLDIYYAVGTSSLLSNIKCNTNTPLDPWINSFTKLMYTITDDYPRFWMFILGVVISIFIAQVTIYISKPGIICGNESKEMIDKVIKNKH